jgi:hypothetical protein
MCDTTFKEPQANQRRDNYKNFNYCHARVKVKTKHAIGILKERWQSLKAIPMRIRSGPQQSALLNDAMLYITQLYTDT